MWKNLSQNEMVDIAEQLAKEVREVVSGYQKELISAGVKKNDIAAIMMFANVISHYQKITD